MSNRNYRITFIGLGLMLVLLGLPFNLSSADVGGGTIDVTVYGTQAGGILGSDLVAGDLDNDGIADLVVNAPWDNCPVDRHAAGAVYVVFGQPSWPASKDLRTEADVTICGAYEEDQIGAGDRREAGTLDIGDVNGDGLNDLIIGAANADGPSDSRANAGAVYVLLGQEAWASTIDLAEPYSGSVIYGEDASDFFGTSVAVGDLDADGYGDIAIGAMNADAGDTRRKAGKVYVWYGRAALASVIDAASDNADFVVLGRARSEGLGTQVKAGDATGDSIDDLVISAAYADHGGRRGNGVVHGVFFSVTRRTGTLDLASQSSDWLAYGETDSSHAGKHVAIGDVNGDGNSDVLIGAPDASVSDERQSAGKVYVVFGPLSSPPERDLADDADLVVYGTGEEDFLGDVAVGDVDGDGVAEMILGARQADSVTAPGDNHGAVYVVPAASISSPYDLSTGDAHRTISGRDPGDLLSRGAVGNVDGQGALDLIAGAPGGDGPPDARRDDSGEVYLLMGEAPVPSPTVTPSRSPAATSTVTPGASPSLTPTATSVGTLLHVYMPLIFRNSSSQQ